MDNQKPEQDERFLRYFDALRQSGKVNMYGAAPYLQEAFGITKALAREALEYWMRTYTDRRAETGKEAE